MAGAFAAGFKLGGDAWDSAEAAKRQKVLDERAAVEWQQKVDDRARAKGLEAGVDAKWADAERSLQPIAYDGSKADFGAVAPEAVQGPVPQRGMAPVTGATELGNPMMNANIRAQGLAIANRDTGAYTGLQKEYTKIKSDTEDSEYALAVQKDPNGPEAKAARKFVNQHSKQVSAKVDPKTGITTFAVLEPGDEGYKDHPVNAADLSKISVGMRRLLRGDVTGLDLISGVNKEIGDAVAKEMKLQTDVGAQNNLGVAAGAKITGDAETRTETARKNLVDEKIAGRNADSTAASAGANVLNAKTNAARATSEIGERDAERKAKTDAVAAIDRLMPKFNSLKPEQMRGPEGQAVIAEMALDAARTSGDASKLLTALQTRVTGTGRKAIGKIEKTDEGILVFDTDNKLVSNMTFSGLELPPGMNEARYMAAREEAAKAGIRGDVGFDHGAGRTVFRYAGASGSIYKTLDEAKDDKGAKGSPADSSSRGLAPPPERRDVKQAPAPDRPGNAFSRDVVPALTSAGDSARNTYLQGKLARGEPLSPAEQVRAKQAGLVK